MSEDYGNIIRLSPEGYVILSYTDYKGNKINVAVHGTGNAIEIEYRGIRTTIFTKG